MDKTDFWVVRLTHENGDKTSVGFLFPDQAQAWLHEWKLMSGEGIASVEKVTVDFTIEL